MQLYTWVRTTPVRCKLPWKCYDRTQGCYRTTTPAPLPSFPLPLLPVPPLPFSPSLYFPLPPFLLSPSLPPFPFPSLPCSEAARNPTKGSGAALWAPTAGPRKNFGYILSPEIVSGGNDFGSFLCWAINTSSLPPRPLQNVPLAILICSERSPVRATTPLIGLNVYRFRPKIIISLQHN